MLGQRTACRVWISIDNKVSWNRILIFLVVILKKYVKLDFTKKKFCFPRYKTKLVSNQKQKHENVVIRQFHEIFAQMFFSYFSTERKQNGVYMFKCQSFSGFTFALLEIKILRNICYYLV